MSKLVKYVLIAVAAFGVLLVAAILLIPTLVDVERYKPEIEKLVSEKTGYPLTLGGDISLSFFPWVGLSFTDLQLDNPEGFNNKQFIRINGFQARLKVMPLLSKKIEVSRFVIDQPEIFLEKNKNGVWNWEKLTSGNTPSLGNDGESGKAKVEKTTPAPKKGQDEFVLQSLIVGEFSITNGRIQIDDPENNLKRELSDFNLQLVDVSLDKPIKVTMQALLDGKPLSFDGSVGPLGPDPGAGRIDINIAIQAFETLKLQANGYLSDAKTVLTYKFSINVDPFSPKQLFSHLGLDFPVVTADQKALEKIGLKANITGDLAHVALSDSSIVLDDSSILLDATVGNFSGPEVTFNVEVDSIDLDRYLPPATSENTAESATGSEAKSTPQAASQVNETESSATSAARNKTATIASPGKTSSAAAQVEQKNTINYDPLRKLVLEGVLKIGALKIHGGTISNLLLDINGRNGLFNLKSLDMELYEGTITSTGSLNVQKNVPVTVLNLDLQDVQVGPLLKDFAEKEIIEGRLKAEIALNLRGDNADLIKQSLNGTGDLLFLDGALLGIDLAEMARNIKSGFTLDQQADRPKTDFAELHAPFSITNGLVNTPETTLKSPFIRATVAGDANLVSEALDMSVKPKLVGTIKGQGDEEKRSGLAVPVLVSGTFTAPEFSLDLEALVKEQGIDEKELSEIIRTGEVTPERKEQLKEELEKAKSLFKGLFGS